LGYEPNELPTAPPRDVAANLGIFFSYCNIIGRFLIIFLNFAAMNENHKSGFVNIIGKPNTGKSTLMNELIGENLSIITYKAQTTRHRILGLVNGEDFQVIFSDTPGYIDPAYPLQEAMMQMVNTSFEDADMILLLIDVSDKRISEELLQKTANAEVPIIVVLNKIDLIKQEKVEQLFAEWYERFPEATIIPISALHHFNIKELFAFILKKLPEGPPYFPKDQLTDKTERFFVSEIIREKIFLQFNQEIPYSTEVKVERFKDKDDLVRIEAIIFVNRKSQKPILIGKEGRAIKRIGIEARKDIEGFLEKKVFLELRVKVRENWRENPDTLKRFGYQ
jgi:GTPase